MYPTEETSRGPAPSRRGRRGGAPPRGLTLVLAAFCMTGAGCGTPPPDNLPTVMLWAWQRPEDLRFIEPETTGVAPLVGTLVLDARGVHVHRRRNPLFVSAQTEVLPVVRIELDRSNSPELNHQLIDSVVESIWDLIAIRGNLRRLQIDFDAPLSVRSFYRELLFALRETTGRKAFLSMTALASWCMEDDWLTGLPVNEIVPMVFGMGDGARPVTIHLARMGTFPSPECRSALGIAVGRPIPHLDTVRRLYFFSQERWNPSLLASAIDSTNATRQPGTR